MDLWSATDSFQMLDCGSEVTGYYYAALNSLLLTHILASEKLCRLCFLLYKRNSFLHLLPKLQKTTDCRVQETEGFGNLWLSLNTVRIKDLFL